MPAAYRSYKRAGFLRTRVTDGCELSQLGFCVRTSSSLNYWAISLAPTKIYFVFSFILLSVYGVLHACMSVHNLCT